MCVAVPRHILVRCDAFLFRPSCLLNTVRTCFPARDRSGFPLWEQKSKDTAQQSLSPDALCFSDEPRHVPCQSHVTNASVCNAVRPHEDSRDCDVVLSVEDQRIGARTLVSYNIVAMRTLTESAAVRAGKQVRTAVQSLFRSRVAHTYAPRLCTMHYHVTVVRCSATKRCARRPGTFCHLVTSPVLVKPLSLR